MTAIAAKKSNRIRETRKDRVFNAINIAVWIVILFIVLYPLWLILIASVSDPDAVLQGKVLFWPVDFSWMGYEAVFQYSELWTSYLNSVFYTIVGSALSVLVTLAAAYALSRKFAGKKIVSFLITFTMFFSGGLIPNYLLINSLHLVGTVWAILIPYAINQFNLIILINFFKSLPNELEEAAVIDGLSYFGILVRIILPLSGAALATVGLYTAVFFWNNWFAPLIYLKSSQYPVMLLLRNIVNGRTMIVDNGGMGEKSSLSISIKSAVIILSSLPIILLYPFLQKYFVKGMTVGAVKG